MENRYSRQMFFQPIGKEGQKQLKEKHILILGCGALGTSGAEQLTRAGIGKLTLIDRDYVEWSNLQRQHLFTEQDAKEKNPKVIAAQKKLRAINRNVKIDAHLLDATPKTLAPLLKDIDLVIDATDNLATRFMLNDLMQKYSLPWIFGSCVGSTGMSLTIIPGITPCLTCLFERIPHQGATCDSTGIISPAVQMVVVHQVTESLKLLIGDHQHLRTELLTFDLWHNRYHVVDVQKAHNPDCPSCGERRKYPYLTKEYQLKTEILCGRDTVQIRSPKRLNLIGLAERLQKIGEIHVNEFLLAFKYPPYRIVFFRDGRTLIHGTNSIEKAKSIYHQLTG